MVTVGVFSERASLTHQLGEFIVKKQDEALQKKSDFKVSVSGGSLIDALYESLVADESLSSRVQWSKWQIYFSDERIVPLTDADSNYGAFKRAVLDKLPSTSQPNVYPMDESLIGSDAESNNKIAAEYEHIVPQVLDLVLLGCGPDGHTCSLFPGETHRYLLNETTKRFAWCHDSPKPPSDRITFTLPVLKDAKALCFVAEGSSKQNIMHEIFDLKNDQLPTALVNKLFGEKTSWFVNEEAFGKVQTKTF
ncbi:CLL_collapsed_G0025010.mRNA.1.CDS.1 [Saccharomyces cerevisiae]|uniref:6-phosphogluconolactonase-like protein n=1 Tax=Saccharomyces cerevisiae (strain Kyokai no. 7 / NBRC 101557) TaxID=721032 RepID=G2WFN7_YEASK|nr:K7_Sol3p [Saccharomyces cerevisiae Kyokai no. 7]CAI5260706.1 CLL_HP2_G0021580.mRNA.1.CDS.1 [Saccharomyces cerevisiae]CAI6462878.1 CLL_HP2_G0021580.mRNA.1.CDS.1 [Saccharomyces cerevisiae]CAI6519293.1 CLL_HP1_G0024750.mRNA.1.CDS.1 [Saccharomyces cerevisiae]CAI7296103.1 CLL_collapsed_G0025010.mRNA.1.CDS.1 [Saccharomyces cerevisiae]